MTNGDRIRQMSDEELVLEAIFSCPKEECIVDDDAICYQCMSAWLNRDDLIRGRKNKDLIRQMSNDNLAMLLNCQGGDGCWRETCCHDCKLNWLNQEVETFTNGDLIRTLSNEGIAQKICDMIEEFDCKSAKCARDCLRCVPEWVNREAGIL